MGTLLAKEVREGWRTWRFAVLLAVLAVSGLISPLLAYYTPTLLRMVPDIPADLANMIPQPSLGDAVSQYVKNVSQFGVLLIVVLTMGLIAAEKERGTAAMLFVRPVSRTASVLAKWLVWACALAIGLLVAGALGYAYTVLLFGAQNVVPFLLMNALLFLSMLPYLSVALLGSALAKSQGAAAGLAFAGLILLLVAGSLPLIKAFMPSQLASWGASTALGGTATGWPALLISLGIVVAALAVACVRMEREEF